jgi:very-short-patch-repair endonuclease
LERILNEVSGGVLRGRFQREWAYGGRWIVDFYFREVRLGIEVEGGYHRSLKQQLRDIERELAIEQAGIVIVRVANEEVFGDREALLNKLRDGWRQAQTSIRKSVARTKPVQRRRLSTRPASPRRLLGKLTPYAGGWTSVKQGITRVGDAFEKSFVSEGIAGSRDDHRANAKQQFSEMRKRSRGD